MNKRLVVGLSSIPSRFSSLNVTLNSLQNQTRKIDEIYLYIPTYYKRFKIYVTPEIIPDFISTYTNVKIVTGEDYGPISKLFVSLSREIDPETSVLICDDDCAYDKNWVKMLEDGLNRYEKSVVSCRGRIFNAHNFIYSSTKLITSGSITEDTKVDIVLAMAGCGFKRSFFEENYINKWRDAVSKYNNIFFNDDIWISGTMQMAGVSRIVLASHNYHFSNNILPDALFDSENQNARTNNQIQLFKNYWRNSF